MLFEIEMIAPGGNNYAALVDVDVNGKRYVKMTAKIHVISIANQIPLLSQKQLRVKTTEILQLVGGPCYNLLTEYDHGYPATICTRGGLPGPNCCADGESLKWPCMG